MATNVTETRESHESHIGWRNPEGETSRRLYLNFIRCPSHLTQIGATPGYRVFLRVLH